MQLHESLTKPDPFYMKRQPQVNENIRAVLVDWIIDVHAKFKLLPETLFIAVNLIDRYMSIKNIDKDSVQLLGVTALFISAKYEEIYPPTAKDFVYVTQNQLSSPQILEMER
jgi:G2/mitotic-specific cyclin-B, other